MLNDSLTSTVDINLDDPEKTNGFILKILRTLFVFCIRYARLISFILIVLCVSFFVRITHHNLLRSHLLQ